MEYRVKRTEDFAVSGDGTSPHWRAADWLSLSCTAGDGFATRARMLWSATGLYCLYDCQDQRLTCRDRIDQDDLWSDDVAELFLWTDEAHPVYFEYEISPLGRELALMVCNDKGNFMGWAPWHYQAERCIRRAASVRGGPASPGAAVSGWTAELFIPFALLRGLGNVPPKPGASWRANLYRIDHDSGKPVLYCWSPISTGGFHHLPDFGTLLFV